MEAIVGSNNMVYVEVLVFVLFLVVGLLIIRLITPGRGLPYYDEPRSKFLYDESGRRPVDLEDDSSFEVKP